MYIDFRWLQDLAEREEGQYKFIAMPMTVIDYGECLKDSPRFRQEVTVNENNLHELVTNMDKLLTVSLSWPPYV